MATYCPTLTNSFGFFLFYSFLPRVVHYILSWTIHFFLDSCCYMWHYWAIMEQGCGTTILRIKKLKWSFVCFFSCQVMRHAGLLRKASHAHKEGVSFFYWLPPIPLWFQILITNPWPFFKLSFHQEWWEVSKYKLLGEILYQEKL